MKRYPVRSTEASTQLGSLPSPLCGQYSFVLATDGGDIEGLPALS